MTGNVAEWVATRTMSITTRKRPIVIRKGLKREDLKVVRGGSWRETEHNARLSKRFAAKALADRYYDRVSLCERCARPAIATRRRHNATHARNQIQGRCFSSCVLAFAAIPIMGILRGTTLTPFEEPPADATDSAPSESLNPPQVHVKSRSRKK